MDNVNSLAAEVAALLRRRPGPTATDVAELVRQHCAVTHVALVDVRAAQCSVLAAVGPQLLATGTSSAASVSSRLIAVAEGRVWQSPNLRTEPDFDRPIDQLALALGLRSGAGIPLLAHGEPAGGVLLSSTVDGLDWHDRIAAVDEAAGLLTAALGLGRAAGDALRVVVVHADPLTAQGIARVVERGLPAEVEIAGGAWDPRLPELLAGADAVVADASVEPADGTGLVIVHDGVAPASGIAVDRRAAASALVAAVAAAASRAGPCLPAPPVRALSAREHELLVALADGSSYKGIATRLRLSAATVRSYSRSLYAKLDVHSRGEAVAKATRTGLI